MKENKKFAYVNGNFVTIDKAGLSIYDRGLKFGDGVYETIRVFKGDPFSWEKHMERLAISLKLLKIEAAMPNLLQVSRELLERNSVIEGSLRIMITRGLGGLGYLPNRENEYGIVIEANPLPPLSSDPIDLWVSSYQKIPPQCLPAAAKTMQGLSSTLARMEAEENHCFEAVLLSVDKKICEGTSSNIFWVKDEVIYTPSLACGILAGTTRDSIVELWPEVIEGVFTLQDLENADEVFVTNVIWTAIPVRSLKPKNIEYKSYKICQQVKEMLFAQMEKSCNYLRN